MPDSLDPFAPHHPNAPRERGGAQPDLRVDCHTCVAANTTACGDCIVSHVLANDAGPIEFVTVDAPTAAAAGDTAVVRDDPVDHAVALLANAGLVGDSPEWVDRSEFERRPVVAVL